MRFFRIAFIFSLALMILAGCSKEEIQPDPLNSADDIALKGKKVKNGPDHFVPLKGTFEVSIDLSTKTGSRTDPPVTQIVRGEGNATHLGKTLVEIDQTWYPRPPAPPVPGGSNGFGHILFTAANGDKLWADYTEGKSYYIFIDGIFDHADVVLPCVINPGKSTGRFFDAEGSFTWSGIFYPPPAVNKGFSTLVEGEIMY